MAIWQSLQITEHLDHHFSFPLGCVLLGGLFAYVSSWALWRREFQLEAEVILEPPSS